MHVREISKREAREFYAKWHYLAGKGFIASVNYGAFFGEVLRGAVSYGAPNATSMKGLFTIGAQGGWAEIKRLAMDDVAPRLSESRFIGVSTRLFRKANIGLKGLVSLADDGEGHVGTIYRATGFTYCGLAAAKKDYVVGGVVQHRGPTTGKGGVWRPRSRKHVYVKRFDGGAIPLIPQGPPILTYKNRKENKTMIQKIERLLDLMIAHYEKADNPVVTVNLNQEHHDRQVAAEKARLSEDVPAHKKERKPRAPKAEKAEAPAPKPMTEEESKVKVIEVATAYVHRFKTATPDGKTAAIAYLRGNYAPAQGIGELNHAQRVDFIAWLQAGIAAADGKAA